MRARKLKRSLLAINSESTRTIINLIIWNPARALITRWYERVSTRAGAVWPARNTYVNTANGRLLLSPVRLSLARYAPLNRPLLRTFTPAITRLAFRAEFQERNRSYCGDNLLVKYRPRKGYFRGPLKRRVMRGSVMLSCVCVAGCGLRARRRKHCWQLLCLSWARPWPPGKCVTWLGEWKALPRPVTMSTVCESDGKATSVELDVLSYTQHSDRILHWVKAQTQLTNFTAFENINTYITWQKSYEKLEFLILYHTDLFKHSKTCWTVYNISIF